MRYVAEQFEFALLKCENGIPLATTLSDMTTYRKVFNVQTNEGVVEMFFDTEEKEYTATMSGFSGTARTQQGAIKLMLAVRQDTLLGDDEDSQD